MWRWQKSTEKCQLIDMLQFKKVIFVYKYNNVVKLMKIIGKRFLLLMHCMPIVDGANKHRSTGRDDADFGVEYQCCGADGVVLWGQDKKLPDTHYSLSGRRYVDKYGYIIFLKSPSICSIRIRNHLQSIYQNPETSA